MRTGGQTYYLFPDHLGSTHITTSGTNGVELGRLLYRPWGETRVNTGTTLTTWRFTGQREDATIGLYYYGARYYDSVLGRFAQADTIVPDPGDPQALNRYSYALNNPLRYSDPTGMFSEDEIMKYLGVTTWDDVLAFFYPGNLDGNPIALWHTAEAAGMGTALYALGIGMAGIGVGLCTTPVGCVAGAEMIIGSGASIGSGLMIHYGLILELEHQHVFEYGP